MRRKTAPVFSGVTAAGTSFEVLASNKQIIFKLAAAAYRWHISRPREEVVRAIWWRVLAGHGEHESKVILQGPGGDFTVGSQDAKELIDLWLEPVLDPNAEEPEEKPVEEMSDWEFIQQMRRAED